MLKNICFIQTK